MAGYDPELLRHLVNEPRPVDPGVFGLDCSGLPLGLQLSVSGFAMVHNGLSTAEYGEALIAWDDNQEWLRVWGELGMLADPTMGEEVARHLSACWSLKQFNDEHSRWLAGDLRAAAARVTKIMAVYRLAMTTAAAVAASEQLVAATDALRRPRKFRCLRHSPPLYQRAANMYHYLAQCN